MDIFKFRALLLVLIGSIAIGCSKPRALTVNLPPSFSGPFVLISPRNKPTDFAENSATLADGVVQLKSGMEHPTQLLFSRGGTLYYPEWITGGADEFNGEQRIFENPMEIGESKSDRIIQYYFGTKAQAKRHFYGTK